MALRLNQQIAAVATLYNAQEYGVNDQLRPSIEVTGGTVDIYGSQQKPNSPPTGMYKAASAFSGVDVFGMIPNYLYFVTVSGTPVIVVSGMTLTSPAV